jgi:type IV secretion system protein TrbL
MKLRHRSLLILSALVIAAEALAYAQSTAPQSGPSDLLDVYKNATTTWVSTAFGYANKLFGLLAFIDFTWAMIVLFLEGQELQGWIAGFLKKFMTISFFYALLINQSTWFPAIINSFVQIGQQAGGVSGYLNPSSILWTGVQISGAILAACLPNATSGATAGGILGVIVPGAGAALTAASLIPALVALFCALLIFLAYVVITLTFIMATVESYVVMSAGLIFLGFGASRWTVPYTERYISLVVSTGVRLMVLYMIIGLGQTLSNTWVQEASQMPLSTAGLQSLFGLLASVIVFMALAWQVPKLAGSILQGSLQMGSSDLIAPAMSAAIAAGTIGAVATAGVGAVAGGVGALAAGGAAAGGGAGAAGAGGIGGSFMPGGAGGMIPGMGSAMAAGGARSAAPGVEGAINSVPPPSASASGGGGAVLAVDPPPVTVGAQGEKGAPARSVASGGSPTSVEDVRGPVNAAPETAMADGSVTAQEGGGTSSPASRVGGQSAMSSRRRAQVEGSVGAKTMAGFDVGNSVDESPEAITVEGDGPIGASGSASVPESGGGDTAVVEGAPTPGGAGSGGSSVVESAVVVPVEVSEVSAAAPGAASRSTVASGEPGVTADAPVGAPSALKRWSPAGVVPAGEEGPRRKGRSDDRSLGEKIAGIHNTAAQVHQHLPEDSATVSAPTLNIQHGE